MAEGKAVSLLKAQLALAALSELRVGERVAAAKLLTELVRLWGAETLFRARGRDALPTPIPRSREESTLLQSPVK